MLKISGLKSMFSSVCGKSAQKVALDAEKTVVKGLEKGTQMPLNLNNSGFAHYNKAFIDLKGSFTPIGKTLEDIPRNESYFKSFQSGYPLLGKYVPQSFYSVVRYTGKETERYMFTFGCAPCSKLTMYDPVNKVGLYLHLDTAGRVKQSANLFKKSLLENGAELKNLEVRHVSGEWSLADYKKEAVKDLMKDMGLSEKQLIEESASKDLHKEGSILDLKNGQTYELERPYGFDYSNPEKFYKQNEGKFNNEEIQKINHETKNMKTLYANYELPTFHEVPKF